MTKWSSLLVSLNEVIEMTRIIDSLSQTLLDFAKGTNGINAPMSVYQPSGYSHIQTQTNPLQVVNAPITGNLQHPPKGKISNFWGFEDFIN